MRHMGAVHEQQSLLWSDPQIQQAEPNPIVLLVVTSGVVTRRYSLLPHATFVLPTTSLRRFTLSRC